MKDAGHIPMEELPLQSLSVVESFLNQSND
jgi:hypothetical protein